MEEWLHNVEHFVYAKKKKKVNVNKTIFSFYYK